LTASCRIGCTNVCNFTRSLLRNLHAACIAKKDDDMLGEPVIPDASAGAACMCDLSSMKKRIEAGAPTQL
jgi:hypothetical protein